MAEKSFVLLSLKEAKAKKLTQALSNEKARKILEHLSKKEYATETEIAKELDLPLSTVHYNLKLLRENKLVSEEEYHYSDKGKEVIHYKIANKYIIIAPTEDESILEKLKNILPATIIVAAGAIIAFATRIFSKGTEHAMYAADTAARGVAPTVNAESAQLMAKSAAYMPEAPLIVKTGAESGISPFIWIIIGAAAVLVIIALTVLIKRLIKKK